MTAPARTRPGCLPGCRRHDVDHDGATYCRTLVDWPARTVDPYPRAVVVEVDQDVDPAGRVRRLVALAVVDERGHYVDDPILVDPAAVPALAAALVDAARLARDGR